jgi:STE24 endopeptidase
MKEYIIFIFIIYIIVVAFNYWIEYLNISHLKKFGSLIPSEFEGQIDQALLNKVMNYTIENTQFEFIFSIFNNILLLFFLFGGILNIYNSWVVSINLSFILSGLVFFLFLFYIEIILTLPFNLYHTFKIEKKYGFNTITFKLWMMDLVKSLFISTILISLTISVGLWIIQKSPNFWWFWIWCFFLLFGIFIMYISPYVIEPLFNKFTSLGNSGLEDGVRNLMQKVGIKVSKVLKMDASKRTKHTNAYFTGIGKVKRIVLFDTLLEKMENSEILSVLAHEIGHWKKKHILKRIIVTESITLIAIYISFRILQTDFLINLFDIKDSTFFAKIIVLGFLGYIISFPFSPVFNYFSRRQEIEADRFAYELTGTGDARSMVGALVKLSKDNLSNLCPHPLYVKFYYSHLPIIERIEYIKRLSKT